ncbi:MAG: helix-turn-helix domain-containing protein [Candidatus Competibacteraceae bacterium]
MTETASRLKMSRNTLYRKMRKHGIALPTLYARS